MGESGVGRLFTRPGDIHKNTVSKEKKEKSVGKNQSVAKVTRKITDALSRKTLNNGEETQKNQRGGRSIAARKCRAGSAKDTLFSARSAIKRMGEKGKGIDLGGGAK